MWDEGSAERVLVAAAQFAAAPAACQANVSAALNLIHAAAERGARLVVLPECGVSGYDLDWIRAGAPGGGSAVPGPLLAPIAEASEELGVAVVVNDLERAAGCLYSTSAVFAGGRLVGKHRKTTLTVAEEESGLCAGDRPARPVTVPGITLPVAPMICFEHGFPEIALDLALGGAGIIAVSSAIRTGFEYLRNLRTRARAQDNGLYVVAANAAGHGYCGTSMIVDPRGDVVARASATGPDLIVAEVDPARVEEQRRLEPVLRRRRPELRRS